MSSQRAANDPSANGQRALTQDRQLASAGAPGSDITSPSSGDRPHARSASSEVAYYHSFLNNLLDLISHGDEEEVSRIIALIRSGASESQILELVDRLRENTASGSPGNRTGVSRHGTQ
ncbi:uncharacterized protein N7459_005237 [Penicillium hispanicum]|uniref:uncharacterized protein n=1 Tax=Penicillium hispanicum TaxID=1080232 RepID=UPI00254184BB|nr:uncharacterized protein N7459_005237 [Penicillium hispanicum]KAJ5585437.1 hypothetical protein N7459_005237 [Penicillium hispanicum]